MKKIEYLNLEDCKKIKNEKYKEWLKKQMENTPIPNTNDIRWIDKEYHTNGQIFKELNYVNGILNGIYKLFHDNGQLYMEGNFVNGEQISLCKKYYKYNVTNELVEDYNSYYEYIGGEFVEKYRIYL